jgi:beta-alanine--pyruvate transaminase
MITAAKGMTNGAIPMGAVFASGTVHDALMQGPEQQIELFHGYTYSGHPAACAAGLATLDIHETEGLLTRARSLAAKWEESMHSLAAVAPVIDVRTIGLMAGVELEPRTGAPGARGYELFVDCFQRGLLIRVTGDIVALSPPLTVEDQHIDEMVALIAHGIRRIA